jgi:surface antigen
MSRNPCFLPIAAVAVTGFGLAAAIMLMPSFASAANKASHKKTVTASHESKAPAPKVQPDVKAAPPQSASPSCSCPEQRERAAKPKFAGLTPGPLNESDELAALASLHHALNSAGDGQAYIWQRNNGRLSGFIKPKATFRNGDKQICRHVEVMLTTGIRTNRIESTACRQTGGQWKLEG